MRGRHLRLRSMYRREAGAGSGVCLQVRRGPIWRLASGASIALTKNKDGLVRPNSSAGRPPCERAPLSVCTGSNKEGGDRGCVPQHNLRFGQVCVRYKPFAVRSKRRRSVLG